MTQTIYYCVKYNAALEDFLRAHFAKWEHFIQLPPQEDWLCFTADVNAAYYSELREILQGCEILISHVSLEFTEEDRRNAKWLYMRSICLKVEGYDMALSFHFPCENPKCFRRERRGPVYAAKPIKWAKNKYFYSCYEFGFDELFCDQRAKDLLLQFGLPVDIEPVLHRRTHTPIENLYYIAPQNELPLQALDLTSMELQAHCDVCGADTYLLMDKDQLRIYETFLAPEKRIYSTPRIWGPGMVSPATIVSQEVYRFLSDAHMTRGLRFVPVLLL